MVHPWAVNVTLWTVWQLLKVLSSSSRLRGVRGSWLHLLMTSFLKKIFFNLFFVWTEFSLLCVGSLRLLWWGRAPFFVAMRRLLVAVASRHGEQPLGMQASVAAAWGGRRGLRSSVVVVNRLSCPKACGIFPDQGSDPCPLRWQVDSQPLYHQGSPHFLLNLRCFWISFWGLLSLLFVVR